MKIPSQTRTPLLSIGLAIALCMSLSSVVFGADRVNVCNKGDVELMYVSLGSYDNLAGSRARIDGFYTIETGECKNVMPPWMTRVTVAFLYTDKSGRFGNVVMKMGGYKNSGVDFTQICIAPDGGFQDKMAEYGYGGIDKFISKWSPPCSKGYVPIQTSFTVWETGNYTFNVSPSRVSPVIPLPEGVRKGYRTKIYPDGSRYEGQWRNGKFHGQGAITLPDGETYDGAWQNGKRHGHGVAAWTNGLKYVGQYRNGTYHGQGVSTWADGLRYEGQYRNGTYHGRGVMSWPDGRKYDGTWRDGKKHGQGIESIPGGGKYKGSYQNGKQHGQGTITLPNGDKVVGLWENGVFKGSSKISAQQTIIP